MTYRERREQKAERLREWAEKREAKANALRSATPDGLRHDWAFISQPGHIPERARMIARDDRAIQHRMTAADFRGRAAGIDDQAERAIYNDDPDAIERIRERIAELEAAHAAIKARPHESWELSNSNNNIRRYRERLRLLTTPTRAERYMLSKYAGECSICAEAFSAGTEIAYDGLTRSARHVGCERPPQPAPEPEPLPAGKCCKHAKGYHRPAHPDDEPTESRCIYCSCREPGTYGQKKAPRRSVYAHIYAAHGIEGVKSR